MPLSWAVPILQIPNSCKDLSETLKVKNNEKQSCSCPNTPTFERLGFRYVWTVKVATRQISPIETIILQISPKFATVHDHVRCLLFKYICCNSIQLTLCRYII